MERSCGIVTRSTRLGETSWIVHWCTAEHGLLRTVAQGARAPRSRFAGRLDLFFGAEITWSRARRGDLHWLREVAVESTREGLRRDWLTALAAGYCAGLVERAVEPEHPVPELYDLLLRALDHLAAADATRRAVAFFESELARLLGMGGAPGGPAVALAGVLAGGLPPQRAELLGRLPEP